MPTGGLLTKRSLLLAKIEATPGEDANPNPQDDAILVMEPDYTTDPQVIERNYTSNTFSKFEDRIGRVVSGFTFQTEMRGNGRSQSGMLADAPRLTRLFRACGYEIAGTDGSGAQNLSDVIPTSGSTPNAQDTTFTKGGDVSVTSPVLYTIEVVTAGASGVAEVVVRTNNDDEDAPAGGSQVLEDGTPLSLGDKGGEVTPTIAGELAVGDAFDVLAYPVGVKLSPKTSHEETLTIHMWKDGNRHVGTRAVGTFNIEATGGDTAKVTFNFTTEYRKPAAVELPVDTKFEETIAPQVEQSLLTWGGNKDMKAESWSFDVANDIQVRMDVNAAQGYLGSRISDRTPTGGFTPEAQLESDEPFWADFLAARSKTFTARVGIEPGNQVVFFAPRAQTSEQSYGDRNGIVTYDKSLNFKRGLRGDDEAIFVFC